ncbi:zinc-finger homeodomain protein 3-like [Zingiber officinale]|nr:zinc-finger homeodomain protein 3-like [Zingiber officinale]XP_042374588.1 zinc-finger homeodomain protein 3-like [Zingiber officinale]XP_042374595.1 zinc-finger homeodomain protein 3-like [Zingiber officinale]XP_042374601.1 zinc-finger homeodomain protein 3-like [Zingiber officinale]
MMDLSGHEGEMTIPIASAYIGGGTHGHNNSSIHGSLSLHHHHRDRQQPSNGPPPPPSLVLPVASAAAEDHHHCSAQKGTIKYRECLKNHAASIGGNATDGCGEFMPSGEEGTLEALKCSACGCHRNFHRKETEGEEQPSPSEYLHPLSLRGRKVVGYKRTHLLLPSPDHYHQLVPRVSPHSMIMPLQQQQQQQTSESEEVEVIRPALVVKKRARTKFTAEQKEKMLRFAEKAGWRLQKQEESVVQQFCQEIGVKRRVLKVWMHNNKHNLAKLHVPPHLSSLNDHH